MIVRNKALTIEKSIDIATKMIEIFSSEAEKFNDEGDPAEQIYLFVHTIATLNAQFIMSMDGYGKIYAIPNFNGKIFKEWVTVRENEILSQNENIGEEVSKIFHKEEH